MNKLLLLFLLFASFAYAIPEGFQETNFVSSGERPECTTSYMRTRDRDETKEGFLKGEGYKDFGTYGQTFPIVEENLIEYFTRKLPQPDFAQMQKSAETPQPAGITSTKTERTFLFDPTYTLDEDITNDGQVLHKAGTKINPLDYVSWGSEMILIDGDDDKQIAWVKSRAGDR